jgi:hypothetical protein
MISVVRVGLENILPMLTVSAADKIVDVKWHQGLFGQYFINLAAGGE